MNHNIEYRVLLAVLAKLSSEAIDRLKQELADDFDQYLCLIEALDDVQKAELTGVSLKKEWQMFSRNGGKRFIDLMEKYISQYQKTEREAGRSGSLTDLKIVVSNHSKWHRMMRDRGVGKQYRDDMRRACFVFHLSFIEATELLWASGQPFDSSDKRDFILAECLAGREYSFDKVDQILSENHVAELFRFDENENK